MAKHNLYYYPYATMTDAELPLLKASALYFDKLYILDPEAASWGTIGADASAGEAMVRLAAEGVFERLRPEEVIESHGDRLLEAVRDDCRDPEFLKLCQDSGKKGCWTLALAKVPLQLREEEVMRELLGGLPRALVGDLMQGGAPQYAEIASAASAYMEGAHGRDYRYIDLPLAIGESIMVNHALLAGLEARGAVPVTDDPFHQKVLAWKVGKALRTGSLTGVLQDKATRRALKANLLALEVMRDTDLALPVLAPTTSVEEVLAFRAEHGDELEKARAALADLARRILADPWSQKLSDEIETQTIPDIKRTLTACEQVRDGWLKRNRKALLGTAGLLAGAATAVINLSVAPLVPVAVVLALLGAAEKGKDVQEVVDDWRAAKDPGNGLSYLVSFR